MELKDRYSLFRGDCLEVMDKLIEDEVKADLILCDHLMVLLLVNGIV